MADRGRKQLGQGREPKYLEFTSEGQAGSEIRTGSPYHDESEMGGTEVPESVVMVGHTSGGIRFQEPRGKGKEVAWRSPRPEQSAWENLVDERTFRDMMTEVLEGIRRRDQWIGQEKANIGMAFEELSEEQQKTWIAIEGIYKEVNTSGTLASSHIKNFADQLEVLVFDLHQYQNKRDQDLRAEQFRQNQELVKTVAAQKQQQEAQQQTIEELRRTQQAWDNYVKNTLPGKVIATISQTTAGTPSALEIEKRIREIIAENQPPPVQPNPDELTKERADQMVAEALAAQAEENRQLMQELTETNQRAVREASAQAQSAGLSREEVLNIIRQQRRRNSTAPPPPPSPNRETTAQTADGRPIQVTVQMPERQFHRPAMEPWLYSGHHNEDLRAWILACEDFFNWNPHEWGHQNDCIKYVIGRLKENTKGHEFGTSYRKSMEGHEGYERVPHLGRWSKFKAELLARFEPKEGALIAKQEMDSLKYDGDIASYIDQIRRLNHRVRMQGITLRSTVLAAVPPQIRLQHLHYPETNNDNTWLDQIIAIGRTVELGKRQDALLRKETAQPSRGKPRTTRSAPDQPPNKSTDRTAKTPTRFPQPKQWNNLTDEEKKQRETRLGGISEDTLKARRKEKTCLCCGTKGHNQYSCPASKPVVSSINQSESTRDSKPAEKRKRVKQEDGTEPQAKRIQALVTSQGRIYEIEESDEE